MRGLEPGCDLAGYVIERELGRGGMGTVYSARRAASGQRVALKIIAPELARDPMYVARFGRESALAARVHHPNVVQVLEAGEDEGILFIAMRYVPGLDLATLLHEQRRLQPSQAIGFVEQIAAGLDAVHAAGLVHRDVKPSNVLITEPDGFAYLTDFGLAREVAETTELTGSSKVLGTFDYMAPERWNGQRVDARSDVY